MPEQNQLNYPGAFNIFRPVEVFSCLCLARSCYFTSLPTFHAQFFVISRLYTDFQLRDSFTWAHHRPKSLAFDNIRWGPCFEHCFYAIWQDPIAFCRVHAIFSHDRSTCSNDHCHP